jgi:hypothetical protein
MSLWCFFLAFTSIVDTVPPPWLATKAVDRHRDRAEFADTSPGTISAPANPSTATPRSHRNRRIAAPASLSPHLNVGRRAQCTSHSGVWDEEEPNIRPDRTNRCPLIDRECAFRTGASDPHRHLKVSTVIPAVS